VIRRCDEQDFALISTIINDGAQAYKGMIPEDRWTEPYMRTSELRHEIDDGVVFWGYEESGELVGVMGVQTVQDVTLIRHAYVASTSQKRGIGSHLLSHLRKLTPGPVLIGTWSDAVWQFAFTKHMAFELFPRTKKTAFSDVIGRYRKGKSKLRLFSRIRSGGNSMRKGNGFAAIY
jgi:GNAT superfamily N-acetyltransferase